jgi:hypothetical protein
MGMRQENRMATDEQDAERVSDSREDLLDLIQDFGNVLPDCTHTRAFAFRCFKCNLRERRRAILTQNGRLTPRSAPDRRGGAEGG